jgi:hypothetical protein
VLGYAGIERIIAAMVTPGIETGAAGTEPEIVRAIA